MTSQIPTSLSVYFSREDVTLDTEKKPTGTKEKEVTKTKKKEHDWCPHTKSLQSNRGHLPFRHTKDMRTDVTSVLLQISWSCWINVILAVERMLGLHVSIQHLNTPDFCSSMFWLSFACLQDVIGRQWTENQRADVLLIIVVCSFIILNDVLLHVKCAGLWFRLDTWNIPKYNKIAWKTALNVFFLS